MTLRLYANTRIKTLKVPDLLQNSPFGAWIGASSLDFPDFLPILSHDGHIDDGANWVRGQLDHWKRKRLLCQFGTVASLGA